MGIMTWAKSFFNWSTKADPAYGVAMQFYSPGQPVWSEAGVASGIKWKLYTDETMSREIERHPLLDLWKTPNSKMGTGAFVEQVFGFWHMSGNSYLYANRLSDNTPPLELYALRPDRMKIVIGEKDISGYIYGYGSSAAQDFDVSQVMHLKFPSYDDDFYGLSPIEVASNLIDQQNEGNSWNTALMQNAGKPASVFTSKGFLTEEQRSQVREELRRRYSGKRNSGMPLILEADMTWQQMSMTPYELDWLQSRELNVRDIASIFDIAPELVGDSAGKTFANQKEAKLALYTDNALPKMDRFRDHVNMWLVPMYKDLKSMGAYFTYDTSDIEVLQELYQAKRQAQIEQTTSLWNSGLLMQCDAQEQLDLPVNKNGRIYKVGAILIREEDYEAYAQQALTMPAAPPPALAEPLNLPPAQIVDATPPKQPAKPQQQGNQDGTQKRAMKANDDAEKHTGVMIALFLDKKTAKKLAISDGEPASDLHITLAFLGDKNDIDLDIPALKKLLAGYASEAAPLTGSTSGIGRFSPSESSDGLSPIYASVNIPGIQKFRSDLVQQLEASNIDIANDFEYTPHCTLIYVDKDSPTPIDNVPVLDMTFDELWLCIGDDRYSFAIGDEQYASEEKSTIDHILNDIQDFLSKMPEKEIEALYEKTNAKKDTRTDNTKAWVSQGTESNDVRQDKEGGGSIEPAKESKTELSPRSEYRRFMEAMT
ncbi:MAG: phage portal protein [Chloroflexi bacterium 13_1_20CM_50_12]|nr:MAG: phage portal protein [Chloroflexi bacterium 13_1_20CM_50_12]